MTCDVRAEADDGTLLLMRTTASTYGADPGVIVKDEVLPTFSVKREAEMANSRGT